MSETKQTQIPLRVPEDVLLEIDSYLKYMKKLVPGVDYSRTDAVRALLRIGLDTVTKKVLR